MNSKFLNLLGIARRAGKLSFGHDAVTDSIKQGKASLVVICADASERLKAEMKRLCDERKIQFIESGYSMEQISLSTGMKSIAVLSVNDDGFAKSLKDLTREE